MIEMENQPAAVSLVEDEFAVPSVRAFEQPVDVPVEPVRLEPLQLGMDGIEAPVQPDLAAHPMPHAFVYPSRTGGHGHVVIVLDLAAGPAVACTCPAMRNVSRRPAGCWAMQDARARLGLPTPEPEPYP